MESRASAVQSAERRAGLRLLFAVAALLAVVVVTGAAVALSSPHRPPFSSPELKSVAGKDVAGWLGAGVGLVVLVMRRRRPSSTVRKS